MHPRSVVARLMGWQVLASTLAVALVTAVIMFEKLKSETGYLDERMHFFASMLAEAAAGEQGNTAGLTQRLGAFQSVIDRAFKTIEYESDYPLLAQVFAGDGRLIYASKLAPPSAMAAPLPATADPGQSAFSDAQWRGQSYRLLQVRSRDRSTTVVLAESQAARRAVMWPLLLSLALRQFLALLLCLAALWWATRSILRPLSQLTSELMRRQPGELKPFEVQAADQELALLVSSLNGLMQREAQRRDMERGFLADAAHELRTPLAMVGAQAHLVLNAHDETSRAVAAQALRAGIARASHTLTQLLTVARVDATSGNTGTDGVAAASPYASKENINLSELVAERVAHFSLDARAKSIELELQAPDEVPVWANTAGLTTVLDNLLDNAVRYTPAAGQLAGQPAEQLGGRVRVSIHSSAAGVQVCVQDNGPGIAPEHQARVFERFYRVPGNPATGSGLGLAIAQAVAAAQAASLVLGPGLDGVGVGLTVNLPGSAAPALAALATRVAAVASAAVNPGAASSHNG